MLDLGACLLELRFGGGGAGLLALGVLADRLCELPDGAELVLEVCAVCGLGFLLDLANALEVADCGAGLAELEGEALDNRERLGKLELVLGCRTRGVRSGRQGRRLADIDTSAELGTDEGA